jgi:hypothetical protein
MYEVLILLVLVNLGLTSYIWRTARKPSGPERERTTYRTTPTTTGGNPKNALIKTTISRRPRNGKMARAVPIGKPIAVAAAVAAKLTLIDSATISRKFCNSLMVMMPSGAWSMADHVSVLQLVVHHRGFDSLAAAG